MQWVSPFHWAMPCDNRTVPRSGFPDLLPATGPGNTMSDGTWEGTCMCSPAGPGIARTGAAAEGQTPWHVLCRSHCSPSEHHSPLGWGCRAALRVMAATTR